jgi:hypothetical protein
LQYWISSLIIGGGTGLYGDIIHNLSEPKEFINSFIPVTNLLFSPVELAIGYIKGSDNIDRKWYQVVHDGGSFNGNSALVNVLDILIFFYADGLNYTLLFGIPILYFCSILG